MHFWIAKACFMWPSSVEMALARIFTIPRHLQRVQMTPMPGLCQSSLEKTLVTPKGPFSLRMIKERSMLCIMAGSWATAYM